MKRRGFLDEMEVRMEENRKLSEKGGMPAFLAPVANVVGLSAWEALATASFVITAVVFVVWPIELVGLVRWLLVMR